MNQEEQYLNLDDFILLNKIGEGGFGEIYIAVKKNQNTKYVAKISKIPLTERNEELKLSLKREVNLLAQLNHPYVVKFIGYSPTDFHENEYPVIVTEYLSNGSLQDIVIHKNNNYPPDSWTKTKMVINIFGIASIMLYLHKNNVIHRDLKLSNILLDDYMFPKIADFGLAKVIQANRDSFIEQSIKGIKGTLTYLAPEILCDEKDPQYSKASDVYSFAFIVYEMFTHKQTDLGKSFWEVVNFVSSGKRPPFDDSIPECYRNLINKCWSLDPSDRPTFEQIVDEIKNNPDFTKGINKKDFYNYVKLVENFENSIDPSNWFTICPSELFNSTRKVKMELRHIYTDLKKIEGFDNFDQALKNIIKSIINKINPNDNKIVFSNEYCIILFAKNWFDSQDFIKILKYFGNVYFELDYPFSVDALFDVISNLQNINGINVNICLNILDISNPPKIAGSNIPISIKIKETVKSIPNKAFYKCQTIYQIDIPSSVKRIGDQSFYECEALESIIIPSSVESIGIGSFEKCHMIETIEIIDSDESESKIKEIKENTFKECESLIKIILPRSIKKINNKAFEGCKMLNEIEEENFELIEYIGEYSFSGCFNLNNIFIPNNIHNINEGTFQFCSNITELNIPKSITTIETDSFNSCTNLKKITFENPSSLISIKDRSFNACSELEEISIPYTVKEIGKSCFFGCIKLRKISVTFLSLVEDSVFDGCASLEKIIIPHPASSIGIFAFNNCSSLKNVKIPNSVISINNFSFRSCTSLTELTIPSSVKIIGLGAFKSCSSLTKISIPSSVEEIGKSVFEGCINLKEIEIEANITIIEEKLFKGCKSLTEMKIPASVIELGKESFCLCLELKNIELPNKLKKIDERTFSGCRSIETMLIPKTVQEIGHDAFARCSSLQSINIPTSIENIETIGLEDKNIIHK